MADRRKRTPMPTVEELQDQARLERRRERRTQRHARKKAAESPEEAQLVKKPQPVVTPIIGDGIKTPEQLRADFNKAFDMLGGVEGLTEWGRRYPKEFYSVWARLNAPALRKASESNGAGSLEDMLDQLGEDD